MNVILVLVVFTLLVRWALRVQRRRVPTWLRHPLRAQPSERSRTVLVTGATGFIGRRWCRNAIERGDRLIVWTRAAESARDLFGPHALIVTALEQLPNDQRIDAIVNLAGAPIMGAPWTQRRRALLVSSRVRTTAALVELIERLEHRPQVLVSMSAIGYYGVRGDEEITEADRGRPIFQSHLCQMWELAAQAAEQHGVRVCRLRAGLVLGIDGGALPQLARSARMRLAVAMGSGAQWQSWIHIDDVVRLIDRCIDDPEWSGAFNATAPEPIRQAQFALELATHFGRSLHVRVPARVLRLALGEMAQLLVDGQRVLPLKAMNRGFEFEHATLDAALAALYPRSTHETLDASARILYDPACPVCDHEMRRYCRSADRRGLPWTFADVAVSPEIVTQCRIDGDTARRRVYVLDARGRIHSGMDAIALIWTSLPRWRWAAAIVRLPLLHAIANLIYDSIVAPTIWRWSTYRRARGIKGEVLSRS